MTRAADVKYLSRYTVCLSGCNVGLDRGHLISIDITKQFGYIHVYTRQNRI